MPPVTELPFVAANRTGKKAVNPRAYALLTGMEIVRDLQSVKAIQMGGIRAGTWDATHSTVARAYSFPVTVTLELHYLDTSVERTTQFVEKFLIASVLELFNYTMRWGALQWLCRVELPDKQISLPRAEIDDAAEPGIFDTNITLILHTRIGFYRDVSKVNSTTPIFNLQTGFPPAVELPLTSPLD